MPLFSAGGLTTSVPYQSGAFAFDPISANPYNLQQTSYYSPNIAHAVSYAATPNMQSLSTARDARDAYVVDRSLMVKSESTSPIQSASIFHDNTYATEYKRSNSEPTESSNNSFATDVDTLMRAIQAKQTDAPETLAPVV